MKALAERYAGALVDVALENNQADLVKQELADFAALMRESPELHAFLSDSAVIQFPKVDLRRSYFCSRSSHFLLFKRRLRTLRLPHRHLRSHPPRRLRRRAHRLLRNNWKTLVSRIALFPDPLLAQILTAATFWDEIPEAASWANERSNLKGDALVHAIRADNLQWDPGVLALLPFPSVLNMMAQNPTWT